MKRILITGANSYIGTSFENYLKKWPDQYQVDTIDLIDGSWRENSFANYDTVFHVAGIAHQKETKENAHLYYKVNRDLAIEVAEKAKEDGVKQFVFMSSMSVYGLVEGTITKDTVPNPRTHYGTSKLQAEEGIIKLHDDSFKIAIVRPPMIYGDGCKGNYSILCKCAKTFPVFPNYKNRRSMLSIENLCRYIQRLIKNDEYGYFYPQDPEYKCTTELVRELSRKYGHKIFFTRVFNPIIKVLRLNIIKKVFGDLIYKGME